MAEWWCADNGENLLAGDNIDPDNPPRLPDEWIIDFIREIPEARASFFRLLPNMLPDEQTRLGELLQGIAAHPQIDDRDQEDLFQNRSNQQGIRVAGPNGGAGYG